MPLNPCFIIDIACYLTDIEQYALLCCVCPEYTLLLESTPRVFRCILDNNYSILTKNMRILQDKFLAVLRQHPYSSPDFAIALSAHYEEVINQLPLLNQYPLAKTFYASELSRHHRYVFLNHGGMSTRTYLKYREHLLSRPHIADYHRAQLKYIDIIALASQFAKRHYNKL